MTVGPIERADDGRQAAYELGPPGTQSFQQALMDALDGGLRLTQRGLAGRRQTHGVGARIVPGAAPYETAPRHEALDDVGERRTIDAGFPDDVGLAGSLMTCERGQDGELPGCQVGARHLGGEELIGDLTSAVKKVQR